MEEVSIGGRITAMRGMGRGVGDVLRRHGRVGDYPERDAQSSNVLKATITGDDYDTIRDLDIGDWIGVSGPVMRTRTGEVTVQANQFTVLCKSLRSLPDKWHGLTDTRSEPRYSMVTDTDTSISISYRTQRPGGSPFSGAGWSAAYGGSWTGAALSRSRRQC